MSFYIKYLLTILTIVLCINFSSAQSPNAELLNFEHRIFLESNDTIRTLLRVEKLDFIIGEDFSIQREFEEAKLISHSLIVDSCTKQHLLWNKALISYLAKEYDYALNSIEELDQILPKSNDNLELLRALIYFHIDQDEFQEQVQELSLKDSLFNNLNCLLTVQNYELKNKRLYNNSSYWLPGLGMIFSRSYLNGISAAALFTATCYGVYILFKNNFYINGALWGSTLIPKFYFGNITNTETKLNQLEAKRKSSLANECERAFSNIFKKYSLEYNLY